jgi:hypothetical protein
MNPLVAARASIRPREVIGSESMQAISNKVKGSSPTSRMGAGVADRDSCRFFAKPNREFAIIREFVDADKTTAASKHSFKHR